MSAELYNDRKNGFLNYDTESNSSVRSGSLGDDEEKNEEIVRNWQELGTNNKSTATNGKMFRMKLRQKEFPTQGRVKMTPEEKKEGNRLRMQRLRARRKFAAWLEENGYPAEDVEQLSLEDIAERLKKLGAENMENLVLPFRNVNSKAREQKKEQTAKKEVMVVHDSSPSPCYSPQLPAESYFDTNGILPGMGHYNNIDYEYTPLRYEYSTELESVPERVNLIEHVRRSNYSNGLETNFYSNESSYIPNGEEVNYLR